MIVNLFNYSRKFPVDLVLLLIPHLPFAPHRVSSNANVKSCEN